MKSELNQLNEKLKQLEESLKTYEELENNGNNLTRKQKKEYTQVLLDIESVKEEIVKNITDGLSKKLDEIANNTTLTDVKKEQLLKSIKTDFGKLQKIAADNIKQTLEIQNIGQLKKTKASLIESKSKLESAIALFANDDSLSGQPAIDEFQEKINNINNTLNEIEKYESISIDKNELDNDLDALKNNADNKEEIITKYQAKIDSYKSALSNENNDVNDDDFNDITDDPKDTIKAQLASISEFFKKHKKGIIAIGSAAVLTVALIVTLKSCSKDNKNKPQGEDLTSNTVSETSEEIQDKLTIEALTNKGYDEFAATLMVKNFSAQTIEVLLNKPYFEAVENYVTVSEFNLEYIMDYETALNIFNIAPEKAVDYVNRAYEINKTNFYEGATINEIVEVVMAIDEKNIFKSDNAALDNSINNVISEAVIDFNDNKGTDEMVAKMGALPHFAKAGSDLEAFLKEYSTILQSIIKNTNNKEEFYAAQNRMYTYLYAFVNAHNGYVEEGSDIVVNENAIVKDTFDWYLAYQSFVRPAWTLFMPNLEKNPEHTELYNNLICLQETILGITKLEPYVQYCHEQELTLGGEQ